MSKHTQGPFLTYGQTVTGPHGVSLAFCGEGSVFGQGYSYSTTKKECRANAVLFAAAPDLLRLLTWALPEVESRLQQELSDGGVGMAEDFDRLYEAQALIRHLGEPQ